MCVCARDYVCVSVLSADKAFLLVTASWMHPAAGEHSPLQLGKGGRGGSLSNEPLWVIDLSLCVCV